MTNLITQQQTMNSYFFLKDIINPARLEAGENKVRNDDFLRRVEDEIDDLGGCEIFASHGNDVKYYNLTMDQMMLVGMRESKAVRKNVLARLKEIEKPKQEIALPETYLEALKALVVSEEEKILIAHERDEAIRTKAMIGSKREATAMAKASAESKRAKALEIKLDESNEYATLKRMEIYYKRSFSWRLLKKSSIEMGLSMLKAQDANYGEVNTYHKDVWKSVYNLEIK